LDGLPISLKIIIPISYLEERGRNKSAFRILLDEALKLFNGSPITFFSKMGPCDPVLRFLPIRS